MSLFLPILFIWILSLSLSSSTEASVPTSNTFNYITGSISDGVLTEADGLYYTDLHIKTHPFALCLYGLDSALTSGGSALTLALRLDSRVVWQANRGKPIGENSTLTFGSNGNLVLANGDDGRVVWQTNTANKGVVDIRLLSDGNLVLLDKAGRFVWQSFEHPTDSILVGQSLLPGDQNKLASVSYSDGKTARYSVVIEGARLVFYSKTKQSPTPEKYSLMESYTMDIGITLARMTLESGPVSQEPSLYDLRFNFTLSDSTSYSVIPAGLEVKLNTTYSFLRLGQDGNLRIFTYSDNIVDKYRRTPWDESFTMFSRRLDYDSECHLPERCGSFGVCEENQCVACPSPRGLLGWSNKCASPKLGSCGGPAGVDYYRVVGVDHFSSNYSGHGPVRVEECRDKCSGDCKCLGFFYRKDTSTCLVTAQLNTLTKVSNSSHLGYIKYSK